jgi:dihydroorotate dehydrogenase
MADLFRLAAPLLARLEPERAHRWSLWSLRHGLTGSMPAGAPERLRQHLFGLAFANPLGLAAGADKNAEAPADFLRLGFGFVEVGTLTPRPQAGNPRPRLFRLPAERALINRLGFNNQGLDAGLIRLRRLGPRAGPIGVNVGANRDAADPIADYVAGLAAVAELADYVTVNISSPNTAGLRDLQERRRLEELLARVMRARAGTAKGKALPVLVKLAPDLDDRALAGIAEVLLAAGVDGAIMGNTTVGRPPGLVSRHRDQAGGLSGRPLFALSTAKLATLYRALSGRLPLVGAGGVESAETAYAKIKAGASLVQFYTGLVYAGPALIPRIVEGLDSLLARDGFANVAQAVGTAG